MEITNFDDNTTYIHNYTSLDSVYEPAKTVIQELESENLSDKLDRYYRYVKSTVLNYQCAATGLFPTNTVGNCNKAKVRDCLYCAAGIWAVALAYRRIDDDKGRTHELEYSAIKCMRGILYCYMHQADKVESFKNNPSPSNCLHSVFNVHTGDELLSYDDYGHLQIDAVSLFLLYLVEMISSGLQIIYNTDEVSFIQNLVFCVERSYRRPDYGMWERGSKYNNGSTELHSSSVGMAKAALEAINGFNLFGNQGCSWSVIFVDFDAHNRNRQTLCSLLPRESRSHNTDAALLPCITYPAFAVDDDALLDQTLEKVIRKLKGRYGLKRFSRDGYRTGLEDHSRRYYKPAEIKLFDGIECEFPLFYIYLAIDGVFRGKPDEVKKYMKLLEPLLHQSYEGFALVPKYYYVPADFIELERESPGSQKRFPSRSGRDGSLFLWGQALYIIAKLLVDELISPQDVDPCRRYVPPKEQRNISLRYSNQGLSENDVVVHVSLIAESQRLQVFLNTYGIQTQTPQQVEPIQIWPQQELVKAYLHLGVNKKLKLSGRPNRPIGCIGTSKLYRILGKTIVCYPIVFDLSDFYMAQDVMLLIDDIKNLLLFTKQYWKMNRRPLFLVLIREDNIKGSRLNPILDMLAAFKNGNVGGVKVHVDRLQTLISGAVIEQLDFLRISDEEEIPQFVSLEELEFPKHSKVKRKPSLAAGTDLVEHMEINLNDWMFSPTSDILHKLSESTSLTSQAMLLSILLKREGPNFITGEGTVIDRLEKIYQRSGSRKHWLAVRYSAAFLELVAASIAPNITSLLVHGKQVLLFAILLEQKEVSEVNTLIEFGFPLVLPEEEGETAQARVTSNVRFTASVLGKQVDSLAPSITRVLVQGKQVTIGVFGQEEEVISNPLSPAEIKNIVFNKCAKHDVREAVLQQELVIHIGWLISNSPELFNGMLKFRIGWIIHAMKHALKVRGEDLPTDYLYQMSPSDVKKLLLDVLQPDEKERSWLNRRHLDGSLNRTPKGFYDRVWQILERTPEGIKVTGKHLPQQPTLSDMTMYEMNFSLLVEDTLQDIVQPEYRQIVVELLMVVSAVLERNPELEFASEVNLDNLVKSAFDEFKNEKKRLEHVEIKDMTSFYNTPPLGIRGTASYLMKAVMNTLLEGEVRSGLNDPCVIC